MRLLATILIALLLAASVLILGYAGWLTLRRVVLPGAPVLAHEPLRAGPTPPARLPPQAGDEAAPNGSALVPAADFRIAIAITITNLPAGLDRHQAGLALFGSADGSDFRFHRLADLGEDLLLQTQTLATGALRIVLAEDAEQARHSFLCRVDHEFARQPAGATPLALDATAQRLRFVVAGSDASYGPLLLRRRHEPDWHAPRAVAAGLRSHRDAPCELWLGAGEYELSDPLRPDRQQTFTVPGEGTVTLNPAFAPSPAPPRSDRL